MVLGLCGYGVAIPRLRIKREEYARAWGSFAAAGISEKAVLGYDEDILTLATKAAKRALDSVPLPPSQVTRVAFASTSPPYREKLLSATILAGLGIPNEAFTSDHTSSTRAGTEAMIAGFEYIKGGPDGKVLVASADAPVASMWDPIEHGLGAGASAFVLGQEDLLAELEGYTSYASEYFGERFRTREDDSIRDLNVKRFNEGAFLTNTTKAGAALLKKLGRRPDDYAHVIVQQPDARWPAAVAGKLGFQERQLAMGLVSVALGDLGAASPLVALAACLDAAKIGDRIFVLSYGSGAGSDALSFRVVSDRKSVIPLQVEVDRREYIGYVQYLKIKGAIK